MRHRVHGRKLGRTSAHRKALFRNQLTALFTHDRIITTVSKAKELRRVAEPLITLAKTDGVAQRRLAFDRLRDAAAVGKLVAERAVKAGVKDVVFDRGGYIFHGRVKALADAAREAGLSF